jgi:hypothetical protein
MTSDETRQMIDYYVANFLQGLLFLRSINTQYNY